MAALTAGDVLADLLVAHGIRRVWTGPAAPPVPGLAAVRLPSDRLAALVADAEGAVGPGPGVAIVGADDRAAVRVSARPGAAARPRPITVDGLAGAVRDAVGASAVRPGCVELELAFGLSEPVDKRPDIAPRAQPLLGVEVGLPADGRPVVLLAGGGVLRSGAVDAVRRLAIGQGWGVLNTWTAKGLFPWDDPHHLGTAGLQADDFELAGLADAGLVIACGVDPAEAPRYRWALTEVAELAPNELVQLADRRRPLTEPPTPERPALYSRLAEALAPHYAGEVEGSPAAAVLAAKADLPPGGLLTADPGPAGLWVARTFPTDEAGSVAVPAVGDEGFAAAAALGAVLGGRGAVAVTHEPTGPATEQVLAAAEAVGVSLDLRVWGPATGVDLSLTSVLEQVAGSVVAWT